MFPQFFFLLFLVLPIQIFCQYNVGTACLPIRRNYRKYWPCEDAKGILEDRQDRLALLRGEPSAFARTGFYDRLFRDLNLPAVYGDNFNYYPNYGYNPNLPSNGPYRYSNWFVKSSS